VVVLELDVVDVVGILQTEGFPVQSAPTFEHPEEQLQTCSHSLSTPAPEHCS
jgi:hypothetical protein